MINKSELKYYSTLLQKKYREEERKFLVEGPKLISSAIDAGLNCEIIFFTEEFEKLHSELFANLKKLDIRSEEISKRNVVKLSDTNTPQEIVGVFSHQKNIISEINTNTIVALENINDPGNLGAIIRNCDWFGFETILLSENCAELYNPKVIRSSAGSVFHVQTFEKRDFYSRLTELKREGYKILCADLNGKNVYQNKWVEKFVIAFANEANGPTDELISLSDSTLTIPGRGKAESLNVANAAAIILSEISKTLL